MVILSFSRGQDAESRLAPTRWAILALNITVERVTKQLKTAVFFIAMVASLNSNAEIYHWKDNVGNDHYSDRSEAGAESLKIDPGETYHRVRSVYDGDTIRLESGERVRLLAINTPEVEGSKRAQEAGGDAAKAWLTKRIEGKKVRLESDLTQRDKYGRRLAHIFSEDSDHINRLLVEQGLATVVLHPPNLKYAAALLEAQRQAEKASLGVWGDPAYRVKPITTLLEDGLRGWQRLQGVPTGIRHGRRYLRLAFGDRIDVKIPLKNLAHFPAVKAYIGQSVEVRGWPARRKDHYTILVRHPSMLIINGEEAE